MSECLVGWAHVPFGKHDDDVEAMIVQVANAALADAGLEAKDVDAVVVGQFNGGFVSQDFPAALVFQADPAFRFKPATRVENACATGSTASHVGLNTIRARKGRVVLVVGAEKMTELPTREVGDVLLKCSYVKEESQIEAGFAGAMAAPILSVEPGMGDTVLILAFVVLVIGHRWHGAGNARAGAQASSAA